MPQWLSRFFGHTDPQHYHFGRGLNATVNPEESTLYFQSTEAFEKGQVLDAYATFLTSLQTFQGETPSENVTIEQTDDQLQFTLIQGSLLVKGVVSAHVFKAYALIADATQCSVAVKRRLIERNYQLTYARYYIHADKIYAKIYLDNTTMSPQKVFYPLRELALNGDYEKEFIASEFSDDALLETSHLQPVDDDEKKLKYDAMQTWVSACQDAIAHLPANDNAGMVAFTCLTLLMQIDYLIVPRKKMGRDIMRRVSDYFQDDDKSVEEKNAKLETYIASLKTTNFQTFSSYLYRGSLTFSPLERTNHDEVATFIDETFGKVRWYKTNRYPKIIMTIYRYIPLYLLYNYGMHPSLHSLLHLLIQIQHSDYFDTLGFQQLYDATTGRFDRRTITQRVGQCIKACKEQFPELEDFSHALNFTDLEKFSYSFLLQVKHLDYSEL